MLNIAQDSPLRLLKVTREFTRSGRFLHKRTETKSAVQHSLSSPDDGEPITPAHTGLLLKEQTIQAENLNTRVDGPKLSRKFNASPESVQCGERV
jgi:hypothetical protein